MFIGEYTHSVDEKGRVSIPAKFRQDLSAGVVVTRGFDGCLLLYPLSQWEEKAATWAKLPITQKKNRDFTRLMLAGAWSVILDTQGRISVPEYLRKYAGIHHQVTIAGLYDRIEIWDEDAWQAYKAKTEADSDNIAEAMDSLSV